MIDALLGRYRGIELVLEKALERQYGVPGVLCRDQVYGGSLGSRASFHAGTGRGRAGTSGPEGTIELKVNGCWGRAGPAP